MSHAQHKTSTNLGHQFLQCHLGNRVVLGFQRGQVAQWIPSGPGDLAPRLTRWGRWGQSRRLSLICREFPEIRWIQCFHWVLDSLVVLVDLGDQKARGCLVVLVVQNCLVGQWDPSVLETLADPGGLGYQWPRWNPAARLLQAARVGLGFPVVPVGLMSPVVLVHPSAQAGL